VDTLFTWIHLSDMHVGHGDAAHAADQRMVLAALRKDLAEVLRVEGLEPDAVLVTGDIAWAGKAQQYTEARAWLGEVATTAGLAASRVYVVPGNHDIDHDPDERDAVRLVQHLRAGSEILDEALVQDARHFSRRQQPYLNFAAGLAPACGDLFWVDCLDARGGLRVRLVGLNTALLSAEKDDHGKLRVGMKQIETVLAGKAGELIVVLSHHPFSGGWLADQVDADRWIRSGVHLHLFGHVKDADSEDARRGAGRSFLRLAAGAAHRGAGEPPAHGYAIGAVVAREDGSLWARIWPRRWADKLKKFRKDQDNLPEGAAYAEHPVGLRLDGSVAHRLALSGTIPDRRTVMLGWNFALERRTHDELLDAQMVRGHKVLTVLLGDGGSGKSTLANAFVARHHETFGSGNIAWVDVREQGGGVSAAAEQILGQIGQRQQKFPSVEVAWMAVLDELSVRAARSVNTLIVFDNVDSYEQRLLEFIEATVSHRTCKVLVTTQRTEVARRLDNAPIRVSGFEASEAINCLQGWLSDSDPRRSDRASLGEAAARVENLPLLVNWVGEYLRRHTHVSPREVQTAKGVLDAIKTRVPSLSDRKFLAACAVCSETGFSASTVGHVLCDFDDGVRANFDNLRRLSIIQSLGGGRYALLPVVREAARKLEWHDELMDRHADWVVSTMGDDLNALSRIDAVRAELTTAAAELTSIAANMHDHQQRARVLERLVRVCERAWLYWRNHGPWGLADRALEEALRAFGDDDQNSRTRILLLWAHANIKKQIGEYGLALALLEKMDRAAATADYPHAEYHRAGASAMLALLHRRQGRDEETQEELAHADDAEAQLKSTGELSAVLAELGDLVHHGDNLDPFILRHAANLDYGDRSEPIMLQSRALACEERGNFREAIELIQRAAIAPRLGCIGVRDRRAGSAVAHVTGHVA
jgi:tetratricopeptide (TPR) repeat protein